MKTNWIRTDEIYSRILAAEDMAARERLYLKEIVGPWKPMMDMVAGMAGPATDDPLAGARAWAWLLPDQVEAMEAMLEKLEAVDAWGVGARALETAVGRFAPYAGRLPIDQVEGWLVLADPARSNSLERGYTGATDWTQPRFVGQFWDPNEYNLKRLPGLVAHEMHHLIRLRLFPWGPHTSVADYIVIEGTAEAFAASLFGEDRVGYFVTDVDPAGLETARQLIGQGLNKTGFDVIRGYIFGDALAEQWHFRPVGGMPTYGGYATGYHMVRAFLERSGLSIEEASFLPAQEIVAGSGYFS